MLDLVNKTVTVVYVFKMYKQIVRVVLQLLLLFMLLFTVNVPWYIDLIAIIAAYYRVTDTWYLFSYQQRPYTNIPTEATGYYQPLKENKVITGENFDSHARQNN